MSFLESFSRRYRGHRGTQKQVGFRIGVVSHGGTGLNLRPRQAGGGGYQRSIRCVLAQKSIICLGARGISIGGRPVSLPSAKKLDGIMTICLKGLVVFRCDCPGILGVIVSSGGGGLPGLKNIPWNRGISK